MSEQEFLKTLEDTLWASANKLRGTISSGDYKDIVLGLVFLKYIGDAFSGRRYEIKQLLINPESEFYLSNDYANETEYHSEIETELNIRDYYIEKNIFYIPIAARWETLIACSAYKAGDILPWKNDKNEEQKFQSLAHLLDNALEVIEKDNVKLKGILNKSYRRLQVDNIKLKDLMLLINNIPFQHPTMASKDILGHVYEYFLGKFALNEGKGGGEFYTPKSIVTLIVEMLEPFAGRVYDPACGSGGFFVQSERFVKEHQGKIENISIYGQEQNSTTWKLAAMNLVIRGLDFNLGKEAADTFLHDQHLDMRADYIMANPMFNQKDWFNPTLENDLRWKYGVPPNNNANYAWMQHMIYHLAPHGSMGLLLANGSMSSQTSGEGEIRRKIVEDDLVECMVALPSQLFTNTQIPACVWFLSKNKAANGNKRERKGLVLFIDARELGYMQDRVLRSFSEADIAKITQTFHNWQAGHDYQDIAGFCKSVNLEQIAKEDFILTPGRYVGIEKQEQDSEPFDDKMTRLTGELAELFAKSHDLEAEIKVQLKKIGYEL